MTEDIKNIEWKRQQEQGSLQQLKMTNEHRKKEYIDKNYKCRRVVGISSSSGPKQQQMHLFV